MAAWSPVTCTSGHLGGPCLTAPVHGARAARAAQLRYALLRRWQPIVAGIWRARRGGPHSNFRDSAVRQIDIESNEYSLSEIAFDKYWFLDPSAKQNGGAGGLRASRAAPPGAGSPAGPSKAVLRGRTSAKLAACLRLVSSSAPRRPPTGPGSWRSRPGSPRASRPGGTRRKPGRPEAREAGRRWLEGSLDNAAEGVGVVFVATWAKGPVTERYL